ncbi:MAG: hypothetical protein GY719_08885 [bacterium]|nr:hypothetical protein [bacterium]
MPKPRKHKRRGPKSTRAGCLLCKPHKDQAAKGTRAVKTRQELRGDAALRDELENRRRQRLLSEYLDQLDAEEGPVDEALIEKYARFLA